MSGKTNGNTKNVNSIPKNSVINKPTRFSPRKSNVNGPSKSSPSYSVKKRVSIYSWNEEIIELLIQGVSQYPVLFDITRADYKDVTVHARANDSIAKGLPNNCTGADVKSKWDYLRKLWLNERRELNKDDPSGSGFENSKRNRRKPFPFYDAMGFIAPFIRSRVGRQSSMPKSELEKDDEEDGDKSDNESVKNVHENGNSESQNDAEKEIETENNNYENTESVKRKKGYDESSCSSDSFSQSPKTRRILDSGMFYPSDNEDSYSGHINQNIETNLDSDDGLDAFGRQLYRDSPISSSSIISENIEVKKATNNSASETASSKKSAGASKVNSSNRKRDYKETASETSSTNKSAPKSKKGKNTIQDLDSQIAFLGDSMKSLVESKPKQPELDDNKKDWYSYAANFGIRVAAIKSEDARDQIRLGMENLYTTYKKWKPTE